jgi:hypothetical protein
MVRSHMKRVLETATSAEEKFTHFEDIFPVQAFCG